MTEEPVQKLLKMAALMAILDSESPFCPDSSHQVSIQSDFWFGRRLCLKNFKMATKGPILAFLNVHVTLMPQINVQLDLTYGWGDV